MTPSNAARPPLEPQRGSSLAGKAYWAMVQRVALTAAAIDAGYILLFLWLGSMPLAAINVLSIAMYLGAYRLIQKRYNTAALALIWLEVIGHSALGSLLIGWESGFHYYLLMFIPAIVIANTRGYAAPMVLALLAYYLGLHMLSDAVGPLDPLPARSVKIVNWVHICVVFAMSAALSAFYRRTILIAEARLRKQATRDPLTGLANRSHFDAQATEALERSQRSGAPVTLLLCDVDHFKSLFKVFLKSHKCLAGMGCKARCTADSPCYRQAPQRRRPPGKALARRVGVKSGDWTPRLLAWA